MFNRDEEIRNKEFIGSKKSRQEVDKLLEDMHQEKGIAHPYIFRTSNSDIAKGKLVLSLKKELGVEHFVLEQSVTGPIDPKDANQCKLAAEAFSHIVDDLIKDKEKLANMTKYLDSNEAAESFAKNVDQGYKEKYMTSNETGREFGKGGGPG